MRSYLYWFFYPDTSSNILFYLMLVGLGVAALVKLA